MRPNRLTSPERREMLLDLLRARGPLSVPFLSDALEVSIETIRRDLAALERLGRLQRSHGGARLASAYQLPHIDERIGLERAAKERIADLIAPEVEAGSSLFLGGGSTTLALAHRLREVPRLTVTTVMVDVAMTLAANRSNEVSLCGGQVLPEARSCLGYEAVEMILRRRFDLVVLGVSGVDVDRGFLGPSPLHLHLAQSLRGRCERMAILAPHIAFGYQDRLQILPLEAADLLVTNRPPAPPVFRALELARVKILF